VHKTQVEFKSHFSGKKVRLMGREIWYFTFTAGLWQLDVSSKVYSWTTPSTKSWSG